MTTTIIFIMVIVLFVLAISDLIVGVSNDAVNFLNSAIGSKAAPFKTIMIIATIGILFGAIFSSGMMEVARKGIMHPQFFYLSEILTIFLTVMITDVILLDLFNTYGMPTSTTISIVFELLGAAVAVSLIKTNGINEQGLLMSDLINSNQAFWIISGILTSIVISFFAGLGAMFFGRIVFTFDYQPKLKYLGSVWGSIAITAICYFILIKGAKGTSFMTPEIIEYINYNLTQLLLYIFLFWVIILQLIYMLTKFNILKIVVLVGTFALAMAFAGNDLVNFIGVPLAGYESFLQWSQQQLDPDLFLMDGLSGKVKTPTLFLFLAGLIMAITLWFSSKAKSVTETEIGLASQNEGHERFQSSIVSRFMVHSFSRITSGILKITPKRLETFIEQRFEKSTVLDDDETPAFDLVRASVNLFMASIIISYATSKKLPLSTTYVTFMVAMGSSLADGAWGRESAVYRVSGVLSVIGGWFFTAFMAFSAAFVIAYLFSYGGLLAIFLLVIIAGYLIYHTYSMHNKKQIAANNLNYLDPQNKKISSTDLVEISKKNILQVLEKTNTTLSEYLNGLATEDRKLLKLSYEEFDTTYELTNKLKNNIDKTIDQLDDNALESGYQYAQVLENLRQVANSTIYIVKPSYNHVNNNHKPLIEDQHHELLFINKELSEYLLQAIGSIEKNHTIYNEKLRNERNDILYLIESNRKKQIKRIKNHDVGTRNSILFFGILDESKRLILSVNSLLKAYQSLKNQIR